MKDICVLPIVKHNIIYNALDYAYPLSIMLTDNRYIPYIRSNYFQILALEQKTPNPIELLSMYHDGESYARGQQCIIKYSACPEYMLDGSRIIGYIKKSISRHKYVVLFIDEFYLPNASMGGITHFLHEELFYGFDDHRKVLLAMGINKSGYYDRIEHSYADVKRAYHEGCSCEIHGKPEWVRDNRLITLSLPNVEGDYPYDKEVVIQKISDYLDGGMSKPEQYLKYGEYKVYMGIKYYERMIERVEAQDMTIFRYAHHLLEHKNIMTQNLWYLANSLDDIGMKCVVEEYENKIKRSSMIMRMKLLKNGIDGSVYSSSKMQWDIITRIRRMCDDERKILQSIISHAI